MTLAMMTMVIIIIIIVIYCDRFSLLYAKI